MSGAAAVLKSSAGQSAGRSTRYEANAATREPAWVKWSILGVSLAFFAVFLLFFVLRDARRFPSWLAHSKIGRAHV